VILRLWYVTLLPFSLSISSFDLFFQNTDGTLISAAQGPLCRENNLLCSQKSSQVLLDKPHSTTNDLCAQGDMLSRASRPPSGPDVMDRPRIVSPTLTSRLRDSLHPVVMQNVKLRREDAVGNILPESVQSGAKSLLTDEICESFIGKLRSFRQEIQVLKRATPMNRLAHGVGSINGDVKGPNGSNDIAIASTSQSVSRSENGGVPVPILPTPPVSDSLLNAPRVLQENGWNATSAVPIRSASPPPPPLHSPSHKSMERSDELLPSHTTNITPSASQSKMSVHQRALPPTSCVHGPESNRIPIPMDASFFSPQFPSSREGKRRSHSSSPPRFSRPPTCLPSPHHLPPSPRHQRRSLSPYRHRRSLTPDRRSSFRHRLTPSHHQASFSSHPYASPRDVSCSPGRSYSRTSKLPAPRLNGSHRNHSRSRSYSQGLDSNHCSRPNSKPDAHAKVNHGLNDHTYPPSLPNVVYAQNQEQDKPLVDTIQSTTSPQGTMKPCHNVPGLWFVKTGHDGAFVTECEFEIDKETAVKWGINEKPLWVNSYFTTNAHRSRMHCRQSPHHLSKLSLQLLCLPVGLVESVYETSNLGSATPGDVAIAFSNIDTTWPVQGTLVVEVNSHKSCGKTWLPRHLVGALQEVLNVANYLFLGTSTSSTRLDRLYL